MLFSRRPARSGRLARVASIAVIVLGAVLAPACVTAPRAPTVAAAGSPRAFVLDRAAHHLYAEDVPTLTREVEAYLNGAGFPVRAVQPGRWTMVETDWSQRGGRAFVEVRPAGPGHARIVARLDNAAYKVPPFQDPPRSKVLEWAILKHVDPRTAQAILQAAHR